MFNIWDWKTVRKKEMTQKTVVCPHCNKTVRAESNTQIIDTEDGVIKHTIYKCPECCMPIIIGLDGSIIPQSRFLPFDDIRFLPDDIEELYNECRKCFLNECYFAVVMVSRSILMHIAVDKGADVGDPFASYIAYLENRGFFGSQNKQWIDKIRQIGNKYTHQMDIATREDAEKSIIFLKQLLTTVYEMPNLM